MNLDELNYQIKFEKFDYPGSLVRKIRSVPPGRAEWAPRELEFANLTDKENRSAERKKILTLLSALVRTEKFVMEL